MANYQTTVNDPTLSVALGSPSLAAGDTIEVFKYSTIFTSADLSATDLLTVTLQIDFEGSFEAANSGQLKLTCNRTSAGQFINKSRARRIDLLSTGSTGVIYKIHQLGSGQLWISACKPNQIYASAGTTFIAADVDVTTIVVDNAGTQVFYRKTSGGFAATTVTVNNGSIAIENDLATLALNGGEAIIRDASCTPTTVTVKGGKLTLLDCGTIGAMTLANCVIDFSNLRQALTVSGTTSIGPGVTVRYSRKGPTITWTLSADSVGYRIETVD
jgi:hypothetical protein